MGIRLSGALLAGRAASGLSRALGRGGGSVIAGHVVPRIAPSALRDITRALPMGSVLVSATNGKTTTTRLLSHILSTGGYRALHNRAGANLLSGLYSAVTSSTDIRGRPLADVGVFEVDEATLPAALRHIQPRVLLLGNIFRDQLDRYGEVHFVAQLWRDIVASLTEETVLILNADDPLVASLADAAPRARTLFFGIDEQRLGESVLPQAADVRLCPRCGESLTYSHVYYGHLGKYACSRCSFKRPVPDVRVSQVELQGDRGSVAQFESSLGTFRTLVHLPGLYNLYNATAAVASSAALGLRKEEVIRGLDTFTAAFGRLERITVEEREVFLALVKNPVGFTEVLRTVLSNPGPRTLMMAINDRFADGTDVSWLWDVEFERLAGRVNVAVCAGLRAADMAVRLKYAGIEREHLRVEADLERAVEMVLAAAEPGETVYVLPTYTAMLGVREIFRQTGYVKGFWED